MNLKPNDYVILALLLILLVIDHFMDWAPHNIISWIFVGVIIYSLNYKKYKDTSIKEILNWQALSTAIIVVMVIVFTLIGNEANPGISLTSGVFYFSILLSVFDLVYQWRQIKQGTNDR
ncbi:hypothetical protein [Tenuibacillus multivorans]|uniref:Uncharacterized protein n=1 Tax=Tenuibacillus multivorans TaxID=237069 RepID=A0A1H0DT39_9BACI|nr:hypothetical protein [Tenuibacillus multivorans]GEL76787.1 hypothetical protein TMU01_10220 [Tenuibacillus multivorans]SDN73332.1 hypothetical protein SAMN05216498_2934 [Tenuibacillus multivorans]